MADQKMTKGKNAAAAKQTAKKGTAGTKKESGSRAAAGKKDNEKKNGTRKAPEKASKNQALREVEEGLSASMKEEIVLAVTLLVSILFFLSYINLCGTVGNWLNTFIFGLIGIFGYLFPFLLFLGVAFGISNRRNRVARRKLICAGAFFACLAALFELAGDYDPELKWAEYFTVSAKAKGGGGILGGTLVRLLCPLFDTVATIVILVVFMLICLMLMTGREVFAYIRKMTDAKVQEHRRSAKEREDVYAEREQEASYDDAEYPPQRARVITFPKTGKAEDSAEADGTRQPKEEPIRFVDALKARGKKGKPADDSIPANPQTEEAEPELSETHAPMEEIVSENEKKKPEPTITGTYQPEKVSFYEEELKRKFGETKEDTTTVERNFYDVNVSEQGTTVKENDVVLIRKDLFGDAEPLIPQRAQDKPVSGTVSAHAKEQETGRAEEPEKGAAPELVSADTIFANAGIEPTVTKPVREEEHTAAGEAPEHYGFADTADVMNEQEANREPQQTMPLAPPSEPSAAERMPSSDFWPDMSVESDGGDDLRAFERTGGGQSTAGAGSSGMRASQSAAQGVNAAGVHEPQTVSVPEQTAPMQITQQIPEKKYEFPPIDLLAKPVQGKGANERELKETAAKLESTLQSFGVRVTVTNISCGPAVTQYELQPEQGVKVNQITKLSDDIKLNLAATDIRIEAPIPGKAAVGIEVPNKENSPVVLRELLESPEFKNHKSRLAFAVGKNISGQIVVSDIAKMPHMLIAGATGSGKSVCINTIIMSILYKADPKDVRLIMVDPKVVELSVYNGIPHLLIPVVTDPKKASAALNWAVAEMTDRYQKFAALGVRDLNGYNEKVAGFDEPNAAFPRLPQIVIIVDELADLMMVASANEVEDAICRLAQMARAAGLHLIIATQRPSVNVITGVIKANVPSRVAFAVTSAVDSRTILDGVGAERLLGKGDMLFFPSGYPKPVRIQGAFVSDAEVSAVVDFLKEQTDGMSSYNEEVSRHIMTAAKENEAGGGSSSSDGNDDYFAEAGKFIIEKQKASIGMLQRVYKIGFNRAARIMDQLTAAGVVGPEEGTKPRKILMTLAEFEEYLKTAH